MKERNRFGLTERDMKTFENILGQYPTINLIKIFGSRAIGNYKLGSDIDLAIMGKFVSDKEITKIKSEFEESSLPYKVDLLNYKNLEHVDLKEHIDRVGQTFYLKKEV